MKKKKSEAEGIVEESTYEELLERAEFVSQEMLGCSFAKAKKMVKSGKLRGTIAEVEIRNYEWLIKQSKPDLTLTGHMATRSEEHQQKVREQAAALIAEYDKEDSRNLGDLSQMTQDFGGYEKEQELTEHEVLALEHNQKNPTRFTTEQLRQRYGAHEEKSLANLLNHLFRLEAQLQQTQERVLSELNKVHKDLARILAGELTVLSVEDSERFLGDYNNPSPPNEKLKKAIKRHKKVKSE